MYDKIHYNKKKIKNKNDVEYFLKIQKEIRNKNIITELKNWTGSA